MSDTKDLQASYAGSAIARRASNRNNEQSLLLSPVNAISSTLRAIFRDMRWHERSLGASAAVVGGVLPARDRSALGGSMAESKHGTLVLVTPPPDKRRSSSYAS